jgi:hypothetical protein
LIKGKGNPNEHEFAEKIGVLYSLAYAVRMMPNKDTLQLDILNIPFIH